MAEISLECAIVRCRGTFNVTIDNDTKISKMKEVIKGMNEDIKCPTRDLQLFLAKKGNAWLSTQTEAARSLKKGELHEDIRSMIDKEDLDPDTLEEWLESNTMEEISRKQIHILVVVPDILTTKLQEGTNVDKLTLFCGLVGAQGSLFSVKIGANKTVDDLKEAIKEKNGVTITCDAKDLQLFLAKTEGGACLPDDDPAALELEIGKTHQNIQKVIDGEQIKSAWRIKDVLKANKMTGERTPKARQTDILKTIVVNERRDKLLIDELMYYQRLGLEIQNNCPKHCREILDKIDEIYDEGPHPKPFICVEASSGMGKSQLAFALGGEGRDHPRPWFYWPLADSGQCVNQNVYQNFSSIAQAFDKVVNEDLKTIDTFSDAEILGCNISLYQEKKLWTYGLIIALLRYCYRANVGAQMVRIEEETFKVIKSSGADVVDVCTRMKAEGKVLPFFILDEMTVNVPKLKRKVAFQQNVFRACGLVVVVMGTDATITSLVSQSSHSRQAAHWWMTVVPCFPPYQFISFGVPAKDNAWKTAKQLDGVVELIAKNSRGLFSRYFVDAVVEFVLERVARNEELELTELLDAAFEIVSGNAQRAKGFMSKPEGIDAQLKALSYTHATDAIPHHTILDADTREPPSKKRKVFSVAKMQVHFANLEDEDITDVDVQPSRFYRRNTVWSPECHFPVIDKDVLLYLAVCSGAKVFRT